MSKHECTEERFLKDITEHQMTIWNEDGIHRHIKFSRPDTNAMRFDLITWPGYLCYTGDMGTFVFSRLTDMFEFFRTRPSEEENLHINTGYWAEKCEAHDRGGIEVYDADYAKEVILGYLDEDTLEENPGILQSVQDDILDYLDDGEHSVRECVGHFKYGDFEFYDFWEQDLKVYTFRYVWCCYAIAWGIRQYDKLKAGDNASN